MDESKKHIHIVDGLMDDQTIGLIRLRHFAFYLQKKFKVSVYSPAQIFPKNKIFDALKVNFSFFKITKRKLIQTKKEDHKLIHRVKSALNKLFLYFSFFNIYEKKWLSETKKVLFSKLSSAEDNVVLISLGPDSLVKLVQSLTRYRNNYGLHFEIWLDLRDMPHSSQVLDHLGLTEIDSITCVSDVHRDILEKQFKNTKVFTLRNGIVNFNDNLFQNSPSGETAAPKKEIMIRYFGSLYGKRKPDNFLNVIKKILKQNGVFIRVELYTDSNLSYINQNEFSNFLSIHDPVDYLKMQQLMKTADYLLLILPTSEDKGVVSGKLYDYLSSCTRILALVDIDGEANTILRSVGHVHLSSLEDKCEMFAVVQKAIEDIQVEKITNYDQKYLKSLMRDVQVQAFLEKRISLLSK